MSADNTHGSEAQADCEHNWETQPRFENESPSAVCILCGAIKEIDVSRSPEEDAHDFPDGYYE